MTHKLSRKELESLFDDLGVCLHMGNQVGLEPKLEVAKAMALSYLDMVQPQRIKKPKKPTIQCTECAGKGGWRVAGEPDVGYGDDHVGWRICSVCSGKGVLPLSSLPAIPKGETL